VRIIYKSFVFNEDFKVRTKSALFLIKTSFLEISYGKSQKISCFAVHTERILPAISAIKHRDKQRVVTVYSGLQPGIYHAAAIVAEIQKEMENFKNLPRQV